MRLLFAVMGDKDWSPMVERLAPLCRSVVVTEVMRPRGAPAAAVADAFRAHCPAEIEPDPVQAWRRIAAQTPVDEAIVAAGSLFLVGALYASALPARLASEPPGALHP
jgi:folylpolyglutamate synthase/dihydropteroate synthase